LSADQWPQKKQPSCLAVHLFIAASFLGQLLKGTAKQGSGGGSAARFPSPLGPRAKKTRSFNNTVVATFYGFLTLCGLPPGLPVFQQFKPKRLKFYSKPGLEPKLDESPGFVD
jgi:hypothetical protein